MNIQDYIFEVCYQFFPYMAGAAFIFGVIYHLATDQRSVQAFSTQFLSNDSLLKYGSNLFHVGIIMVFFGHIFGLLAPEWSYDWLITNEQKRELAILMGSAAGLITLAGVVMMALRRATNPAVKANSHFGDWFFLALVILQVTTGLLGTSETIRHDLEHYMNLDRWAQGLVILKGNAWTFLTDATVVHKIHIFLGFCMLVVFPFTKFMHMVALPVRYILDYRPFKHQK